MTFTRWPLRALHYAAVVALALAVGCGKTGPGSDSTATVTADHSSPRHAITPEMTVKFDDMKTNLELGSYLGALVFRDGISNETPRTCRSGAKKCTFNNPTTKVTIYPEQGVKGVGEVDGDQITLKGTMTNNYIIAKLVNESNGSTEDWLGLEPGQTVYWLIEPTAPGTDMHARSRFVYEGSDGKPHWLDKIGYLPYYSCNHPLRALEARFADCTHDQDDASMTEIGGDGRVLATSSQDVKSTWASCPGGCCATSSGTRCRPGQKCTDRIKKPAATPSTQKPPK